MAKYLDSSSFSHNDLSNQKRIWRFLNSSKFDIYSFYNSAISHILENIKSIRHNEFTIVMDHMYTKNDFVTLMFTLKVGKQGIPIWFKSDKTKSNCHNEIDEFTRKKLFSEKFILNAINEVINLFSSHDIKITFLADRWFCNLKLMKFIEDSGHYFCFRAKSQSDLKIYIYDKRQKHYIYKKLSSLLPHKIDASYYENITVGSIGLKCNITIAPSSLSDDPWYILSNIPCNLALRKYAHRFGAIEMVFKSQKTNGLNLEKTKTKNLKAFETLYGLTCFVTLWLTILGIDYTKNYNKLKSRLNIRFAQKKGKQTIRVLSLFNLGLTLFKKLYNSYINIKIKCNLQLYL